MRIPLLFQGKQRIVIGIFCLWLAFLPLPSFANPIKEIEKKITIQVENMPISQILSLITQQTGIHFSYNPALINSSTEIALNVSNQSLEEVFKMIFLDTVFYKQVGKHIIITPLIEKENDRTDEYAYQFDEKKIDSNLLIISKDSVLIKKNTFLDTGMAAIDCPDSIILENSEEMKKYLATLLIAASAGIMPVVAQENQQTTPANDVIEQSVAQEEAILEQIEPSVSSDSLFTPPIKVAQLSFIYPLGTGWIHSYENIYRLSFNVLGGFTGGVKGFEIASLFNINKYSVHGLQLAGLFNLTGVTKEKMNSNGVQLAGGFNFNKDGKTVQLSGAINVADTGSFQASGGINIARVSYFQITGGVNVAKIGNAQLSAGINVAKSSAFQLTAGINVADTAKVQLVAGINVAKSSSFQLASVNVTKNGGFQMGIINVRDTANGIPFGLINIVKKGGVEEFGIEGAELLHVSATFRTGVQRLYTIFAIGYNFEEKYYAPGIGLGTSFLWRNRFGLNLELMHYNLLGKAFRIDGEYTDSYWTSYNALIQFRPLFNLKIAKHFKMFVGPTANLTIQTSLPSDESNIRIPYSIAKEMTGSTLLNFWVGVTGGIKF